MACLAAANNKMYRHSVDILKCLTLFMHNDSDERIIRTLVYFCLMQENYRYLLHDFQGDIDDELLKALQNSN